MNLGVKEHVKNFIGLSRGERFLAVLPDRKIKIMVERFARGFVLANVLT